jgi:nucleoside-diphosphate-sugar epimerase
MSELVFITGGSGHIGSRVIIDALTAGYSVRAAVRSEAKANVIRAIPSILALNPRDKLSFVTIPDLLTDGAYDNAIKGATYAIHVASPLFNAHREGESHQKTLIEPAVKGTLNILEASKNAGSVKRVVITSSVIATMSWKDFGGSSPDTIFTANSRTAFVPEPYGDEFEAYSASKIAALNETEAWMEKEKNNVRFDVVNIFPSFVVGRNEIVTDVKDAHNGTNIVVLGPVTGAKLDKFPGASIHVRDVAMAHVKALDSSKVPGNQAYLLTSGGMEGSRFEDAVDIVACEFPEAVKNGVLSNDGKVTSVPIKFDASASEKALGMKYLGFEEQVKDVVGQYLELFAAAE